MNEQESVIRFDCKLCGCKIRVHRKYAGKKGKCPKCRNVVVIPVVNEKNLFTDQVKPEISTEPLRDVNLDVSFVDVSKKSKPVTQPIGQEDAQDETSRDLQELKRSLGIVGKEPEPVPKRKFPWLIDIFLYPMSKPGLITLGIIIGVPLVIRIILWLLAIIAVVFPPVLLLVMAVGFVGFILDIVVALFLYWYFCECIRDSAGGSIRAPDTIAITPGVGELFWQFIRIVGCLVLFFAPMLIYYLYTRQRDAILWSLFTAGLFFFPMGLLATVVFDSFIALNPLLIIGSIFSTFFQYCGLVLFFNAIIYLMLFTSNYMAQGIVLPLVSSIVFIYLLIVSAHLLGRFAWRYKEKLNWGAL